MPDFVFELFSEEIPARMQKGAAERLKSEVTKLLVDSGLPYEGARAYVTPRRIALHIVGIPAVAPDVQEERKGPRVGAPEKAVEGFLRAAGLASIEDATVQSDPKKGDFYVAVTNRKGGTAKQILNQKLPAVIEGFSWPKSMRWGSGTLRWVRPLRSVLAVLSQEQESEVLGFEVENLIAGDQTFGHRFMSPSAITVRNFDDYALQLDRAKVVLDLDRRKDMILADAKQLAFAQGMEVIADQGLLTEVAGLVEWPTVMMGQFEEEFLSVPEEVIITTIRSHQKCFCLRTDDGKLANRFLMVSNLEASDGGKTIVAGNEKVIRARLSDAKFFWDADVAVPLENRLPKLENIVFHAKLGTQQARVERLESLSGSIAPLVGADKELAKRAAHLAKADLVSSMVVELPELQGIMGRYYAAAQGEDPSVALAVEEHYRPQGPSEVAPSDPVSIAVALADKIDILVGFWAIGEKPTGSKDPYALRRAALGVLRVVLENELRLQLEKTFATALAQYSVSLIKTDEAEIIQSLMRFVADRLKVYLRETGASADLIEAVFALGGQNDLLMITRRVEALRTLLAAKDGQNLLAGYRRAINILGAEEKNDKQSYNAPVENGLLIEPAEKELSESLSLVATTVSNLIEENDFSGAMSSLGTLRGPVDQFFDELMINDENAAVRVNRLNLLSQLRSLMHQVADFSKVAG